MAVCKFLQVLCGCPGVGKALVPYYRHLVPTMRLYYEQDVNLGDGFDYAEASPTNVGATVRETLEVLERSGGPRAYANLKYLIPLYESCHGVKLV